MVHVLCLIAKGEKSVYVELVRFTYCPHMTITVDWDVKNQTNHSEDPYVMTLKGHFIRVCTDC